MLDTQVENLEREVAELKSSVLKLAVNLAVILEAHTKLETPVPKEVVKKRSPRKKG